MSLLGCRFVKWSVEKKAVTAVSADFVWRNKWQTAECNEEMRQWYIYATARPKLTTVIGNGLLGDLLMEYPKPERHAEVSPAENCKCGFYSFNGLRSAGLVMHSEIDSGVMIVTESAGNIVLHEDGFRAQYAKPVAVVYPFTYKMQTRMLKASDIRWDNYLRLGPPTFSELYGNGRVDERIWIHDIVTRTDYGHTFGHDAAMVAQKLGIPIFPPSEVTNMLRNSRMENNLL